MSIDESEKWASQVINELFEDNSYAKDYQRIDYGNINNKGNGHELSFSHKDSDAGELKSSKYYDAVNMCECNSTRLTQHNDLDIDDGMPRSPSDLSYGEDLSSDNNQSLFTSCITTDQDSFPNLNIEISDQRLENLLSDASSPVSVNNSEDTKIIEDLISDMVSITETSLDETNVDVLQADSLKSDSSHVNHSESLKSNDFEINSSVEKTEDAGEEENFILKEFPNQRLCEKDSPNFRRNDERVINTLEFNGCDEEINMSDGGKHKKSQDLKDFYFDRFVENFITEEMEYRWERYDPSVRRKYYQNNQKPKTEVGDGFQYTKMPKKSNIKRQKSVAEIESAVEVVTDGQSSLKKGKEKSIKKVTFSDTCIDNESLKETSFEYFSNDLVENFLKENVILEGNNTQLIVDENYTAKNMRKNSFIRFQDVQQEQNTSLCDNDDDDEIVFERAARVITGYRNICTTIERFFVRPFALVIAECIDLITFVFIMIFCLLYLFYENVVEKALNSSSKYEMPFDKVFKKQKRVIESVDDESLNQMNSEVTTTEEFSENEANAFNFFVVDEDLDKNAVDLNTVSFIDPTDVLKIVIPVANKSNYDLEKMFQKADNLIGSFIREQQTAVITSSENVFVEAILKDKANENYFDTEIIASSQTLGYKFYESRDSSPFKAFKHARSSEKIPRENEKAEYASNIPIKISEDSLFEFKPVILHQEEYILNSTEVEDSNLIAESASRNSNNFSLLSSLCVDEVQSPLHDELVSSSSLNVNLPSFCSRSEVDSQNYSCSMSSLANDTCDKATDSIIDTNDDESGKKIEEENGDIASSVVNLISTGSEDIGNIQIGDNKRVSFGLKSKMFFENISPKSFKTKSPKKLTASCQQELEYTDDFRAPDVVIDDQHNLYAQLENLDDASEFVVKPSSGNSSSELDTLMEPSVSPCEKKPLGRKSSGNLRRRMSSILSNWKNMEMMQCVSSVNTKGKGYPNLKITKKYKKHLEEP